MDGSAQTKEKETMRKLLCITVTSMLALTLAGSAANAGTFDPDVSTFGTALGGLPRLMVVGTGPGTASLATDGSTMTDSSSIWLTTNYSGGSAAFTGVPLIDDLFFTFQNQPGSFAPGFSRRNPVGPGFIGGLNSELGYSPGEGLCHLESVHIRSTENIGAIAAEYVRSPKFQLPGMLGRAMKRLAEGEATREADLLSYVLFDGEFAGRLVELGRADARRHHDELCALFSSIRELQRSA
jgi:hypothetical protein